MKRKTHQEFIDEVFSLVGEEYTVLEPYVNAVTKIKIRHNTCNYEWNAKPNAFLSGYRCPICSRNKANKDKTKTDEEFKKEIFSLVGQEYTFLEPYVNARTKIKVRHNCEKCNNYEYMVKPNSFFRGSRCPKCAGCMKLTDKDFKERVFSLVGNEYTFLEPYIDNKTNIKVRHNCEKCKNHEYTVKPANFFTGKRCPKCAALISAENKKLSQEEFEKRVNDIHNGEIEILGEYINYTSKIKARHRVCNYEWNPNVQDLLNGHSCLKCKNKIPITTEDFKKRVYDLEQDNYSVLGDYVNSKTKILMRHNECNQEFETTPDNFTQGKRCPFCSLLNGSIGELTIEKILEENNINFKREFKIPECKNKFPLRFDFAIFDDDKNLKLLIEYQGQQHYYPVDYYGGKEKFKLQVKNDNIKVDYCRNNNIPLLLIPYTEKDLKGLIFKTINILNI